MKEKDSSSLAVFLGQQLCKVNTALIRRCLEALRHYCNIEYVEISQEKVSQVATIDLSTCQNPLDAIRIIINTLVKIGRVIESDALDHVLYLCFEDRELGGLSLTTDEPLSDTNREKIAFLIDAWLQATVYNRPNTETFSSSEPPRYRPMTLSEKIFTHHMLPDTTSTGARAGDVIRVSVDWILASEASWAGMLQTINDVSATQIWRNDRFWLAGDHIVDPRNKHTPKVKTLIEKAEKAQKDYKMTEYQGQNYTILHTEFVRERAQPGMLVIGSDSHTCSSGAIGCLGVGLGAADVAMSLLTGVSWFKIPESIRIYIFGEPSFGIGGKDVILHILGSLKRNTVAADRIVEFDGPGLRYLSCDDRFAICNMCTEFGAITGIFVPDTVVQSYIRRRKRKLHKTSSLYFQPDDDAVYAGRFEIDLHTVQPYIALYPSPDNVVPVHECSPMSFDGVFIGACTTTEEDLILGALVLQIGLSQNIPLKNGKRHVVFGSLPITKRLREIGVIDIYKQAGFEQSAPGCSFCVGMGADQAAAGETWLSSQNRNFKNRMGKGSFANLSSAAVVAASSFTMSLVDPAPFLEKIDRKVYERLARKNEWKEQTNTETVIYIEPQIAPRTTNITHPHNSSFDFDPVQPTEETNWIISSQVQTLGDFIDTDAIIPAEFLVDCETDEELGLHCLQYTHPSFRDSIKSGRRVIVAGEGFGCGSSREGAPRALMGLGVQCVIAKSFAFIYARNQPTLGLLGIVLKEPSFYEAATDGTDITVDVYKREVRIGERVWEFSLDNLEIKMLRNRGLAEAYKKFGKGVYDVLCDEVEDKLLYDTSGGHVDKSLEW